jgi:hypothetical protein
MSNTVKKSKNPLRNNLEIDDEPNKRERKIIPDTTSVHMLYKNLKMGTFLWSDFSPYQVNLMRKYHSELFIEEKE